jgi:hypothetical protein
MYLMAVEGGRVVSLKESSTVATPAYLHSMLDAVDYAG